MDYYKRSAVSTVPDASPLRIGFIGLNANKGWALKTHYPAILQLSSQFQLTALYDISLQSALDTIQKLKLANATAFTSLETFAACTNIDIIVVSTRSSTHMSTILPLLEYSKQNENLKYLFIEWSLGTSLYEAETIFKAATQRGLQTIISLQGRKSPYIYRVKELISEGYIGDINSIEVSANGGWYGYDRPTKSPSYIYELNQGVDLITTTFGHTIDMLQFMTSSYFSHINAMVFNNIPKQELIDENGTHTGHYATKSVPDHLLFQGTLQNGNVPVSCNFKGGKPTKKFTKNFLIDIHGTRGDIKLEGDAGFAEISNLVLYYSGIRANDTPLANGGVEIYDPSKEITEVYHLKNYNALVGNIFRLYQSIADFHFNSKKIPNYPPQFLMQGFSFHGFPTLMDALILKRLIDCVQKSSETGATLQVTDIVRFE